MKKNSIYVSIYKQDYIKHKLKIKPSCDSQKESCKRLSIPKYLRKKYTKIKKFWLHLF